MLLLLSACIENEVGPAEKITDGFDTADTFEVPVDTETATPAVEECNGLDDDGDGAVDEDFSDTDGDGVADCVDLDCVVEQPAPRSEARDECLGSSATPPVDPWSVQIKWHWAGGSVLNTPTVGDLDGDGVPEVVFDDDSGSLIVLDGATGTEEWRHAGMDEWAGAALGDLTGDGVPEVVGTSGSCGGMHSVIVMDNTGTTLWDASIGLTCEAYPILADVDGDGTIEVIVNQWVFDGASGDVELELPLPNPSGMWGVPAVADLDLDGRMEILLYNTVYDLDENKLLTCGASGEGSFSQPVNVDGDAEGEVLVATAGALTACDTDGTELWSRSINGYYGTAVAVADFDGDGLQEFAEAERNALRLLDGDGTELWVATIHDNSGLSGCTSWDVDLDGVAEVIYADEQDLWVFDGRTGAAQIQFGEHDSRTTSETPAVADVDGDGHGDILYASDDGAWKGVTVIEAVAGDWPHAPTVYNQHAYDPESITESLQVVSDPTPSWLSAGLVYRGQPSALVEGALPNAAARIADLCVASCDAGGAVSAWVQVWSDGADNAEVTVVVSGLPGGVEAELERRDLTIPAGTSVEFEVSTTIDAVGDGLVVRIDPEGVVAECDEGDNSAEWLDIGCP